VEDIKNLTKNACPTGADKNRPKLKIGGKGKQRRGNIQPTRNAKNFRGTFVKTHRENALHAWTAPLPGASRWNRHTVVVSMKKRKEKNESGKKKRSAHLRGGWKTGGEEGKALKRVISFPTVGLDRPGGGASSERKTARSGGERRPTTS